MHHGKTTVWNETRTKARLQISQMTTQVCFVLLLFHCTPAVIYNLSQRAGESQLLSTNMKCTTNKLCRGVGRIMNKLGEIIYI